MKLNHATVLQTKIVSKLPKYYNEESQSSTDNLAVVSKEYPSKSLLSHISVYAN